MNPFEFAARHLHPYEVNGQEIVPRYCPICNGGHGHDKHTFALNAEKLTYNCKRGSCGATGTFRQLMRQFGEDDRTDNFEIRRPPRKQYKLPEVSADALSTAAVEYITKRGISAEVVKEWRLTGKDGEICFNYHDETDKLVFLKYRTVGKDGKWRREKDTKPIPYGMWRVDTSKPVVIVEGEWDALAVSTAGEQNVISVPSGANDFTWVENAWDWLQSVGEFVLFGDQDEPGREMQEKLLIKLGEGRCRVAANPFKDANELLYRHGKDAVRKAIEDACYVPKAGIVNVADIEDDDKPQPGIPMGIPGLDKALGDTQLGEVTVWTGKNGEGKSTILGQVILEALTFGVSVFCYSGELTKKRFKAWINLQAAGINHVTSYLDHNGATQYIVKDEAKKKINAWYDGRLWLYDNNIRGQNIENTSIIDLCQYAAKRHDCKVFIIDNLMTSDFSTSHSENYFLAQSVFVGNLVAFAKSYNVHVHLVAHPKKVRESVDKESIAGMMDITNRADNVIAIERNYTEDSTHDAILTILKNRNTGELGKFPLQFEKESRRFRQLASDGTTKGKYKYGWEIDPIEGAPW